MRPLLSLVPPLLLALLAPAANGQAIYKCLARTGKVTFSDQPCAGEHKLAREIAVIAPMPDAVASARQAAEQERLNKANAAFRVRHARRQYGLDADLRQSDAALEQPRPAPRATDNTPAGIDARREERERIRDNNYAARCAHNRTDCVR